MQLLLSLIAGQMLADRLTKASIPHRFYHELEENHPLCIYDRPVESLASREEASWYQGRVKELNQLNHCLYPAVIYYYQDDVEQNWRWICQDIPKLIIRNENYEWDKYNRHILEFLQLEQSAGNGRVTQLNTPINVLHERYGIQIQHGSVPCHPSITRSLTEAILKIHGVPILCPELVLLYKSTYVSIANGDGDHHRDLHATLPFFSREQRSWLKHALDIEHSNHHRWLHHVNDIAMEQ